VTEVPEWWRRPRRITVVVDNPSWFVPHAQQLVEHMRAAGDDAAFAAEHAEVREGAVAFYLSCLRIVPPHVCARNLRNLVAHTSDVPRGRGFSPLTWQIIEGMNHIPVCLLEAVAEVDAGPVIYREWVEFQGHELIDELRRSVAEKTLELCKRFLAERIPPRGEPQVGEPTVYRRRGPLDSQLDPEQSIAAQFDLLRTVDNVRYPAWFDHRDCRYKIAIEKIAP
jgi:methionyl-tRNA formyltransferase